MDYHHHARLTIFSREQLVRSVVEGRLSLREAAAERGLSRQSAAKWVRRYREAGAAGLRDRSSRPRLSPRSTPQELVQRVEGLRREHWTGVRIAQATGLSRATVSRILTRLRLNKARMLEPQVPVVRYEHAAPGDLLHIDIKKFARIVKAGHRITGLGVPLCRRGRPLAYRLHGALFRPNGELLRQLPGRSRGLLPAVRHRHAPRAHRQWTVLLRPPLRPRLSRSRHHPQAHPHLHAAHQRQGRALHPDRHPRVGLCPSLRNLRRTA